VEKERVETGGGDEEECKVVVKMNMSYEMHCVI
jgi:hypothetical protein